jgi:hypothetical protein
MWTHHSEDLTGLNGLRLSVAENGKPFTCGAFHERLESSSEFRLWFNALLASLPYSAMRWETPPVTKATLNKAFEFVVFDSPGLAARPDPTAFAEHFRKAGPEVEAVAFSNLGGDALMIVPCPHANHSAYGHLAAFVRHAPCSQQQALWKLVGGEMGKKVGTRPVWLNTAGAGVSWLHVRLDDRPKYYGHGPYRTNSVP